MNGKYEGRKPQAQRPFEVLLDEGREHRLEIGQADVLAHHDAFDLMEHRRVRHVRVEAIDASRCDDRKGRL